MKEPIRISALETRRLRLRPLRMEDAEAITALLQDPEIDRWTKRLPWPYTLQDARSFISRQQEDEQATAAVNWGIVEAETDAFTGMIGLHDIERIASRAELGYWMGEPYRGRGYATEAARRVIAWAFELAGFHRIQASHFPGNEASAAVMRNAGMTFEGVLRGYTAKNDRWLDAHLFAVLRDDEAWTRSIEQDRHGRD